MRKSGRWVWTVLLGLCLGPGLRAQSETVLTCRLLSNSGIDSLRLYFEIGYLSSPAELENLRGYQETIKAADFREIFIARAKGVLRLKGSAKFQLPLNVITREKTARGWRYVMVARNFFSGSGLSRDMSRSRFLFISLDLDEHLAGEGTLRTEAQVKFSGKGAELVSSAARPRRIVAVEAVETAPASAGAAKLRAEIGMTSALRQALSARQEAEAREAGEDSPADDIRRSLDGMDYNEAVRQIEKWAGPETVSDRMLCDLAFAYDRMGKTEKALRLLGNRTGKRPDDLQALILLAYLQYRSGRTEEAERTAADFQGKLAGWFADPKSPTGKEKKIVRTLLTNAGLPAYLMALRSLAKAEYAAAVDGLLMARDLGYDMVDCWLQRLRVELREEHWVDLLVLARQGSDFSEAGLPAEVRADLAARPVKDKLDLPAETLLMEGLALEHLGRGEEALAAFQAAERRKPHDPEVLKALAVRYLRSGRREDARLLLRRWAGLYPGNGPPRALAEAAQDSREPDEAALDLALGDGFLKERDVRFRYEFHFAAERTVDRLNRSGLELVGQGRIQAALDRLLALAGIYEFSPTVRYNIAQIYNSLGRPAEAIGWAVLSLDLKRDYKEALDLAANVLLGVGDSAASLRYYEEALGADPKDPLSHYNLGCACLAAGDEARAEDCWRQAVLKDGASLSGSSAGSSRGEVTKRELDVDVERVSAMAYRALASLYLRRGRLDEALDMFEKAIAANPQSPEPYYEAGRLLLARNEKARAQEHLKKYLAIGGNPAKVKALRPPG